MRAEQIGAAAASEVVLPIALLGISKSFAGIKVVNDVSFDMRPGEVHALMGENGAGKSTLIKIMAGLYQPDEGEIRVNGAAIRFATPKDAHAAGIATVHQELLLFPELTVAENIFLGQTPKTALGTIDWTTMRRRARQLLEELDSGDLDIDQKVAHLSVGNRQRIEIARALAQDARVLIMDEPTAALAEHDVQRLMSIVRNLRKRGVAIVYVSHRMPEIFALADRVTVLRDGHLVGTKAVSEVDEPTLVSMMVGRPIDRLYPAKQGEDGDVVLELANVAHRSVVRDISFQIRRGEILGLAGLVGSGRTETALTIFGITPATAGQILIDGKPVTITSPEQARDLRIAYVPEDRAHQGLIRPQTIEDNIALANLKRLTRGLFIDAARVAAGAREAITRFGIRARGPEQPVRQLSGGNQQKVVLAKWLATNPRILIMDEPTRGIDVGAKAEIHQLMRRLAGEGMAILMISSELPEVLGMSDRVLVMNGGRIVGEFDKEHATAEAVGTVMTRSYTKEQAA
ncbi:D-xylose ABC transporter ATP-binding protein [Aestuariivirga litoralis]|uniref:D-xylose ABC transporter ATP-binding protein n=1 Tax=Aestuariivirga litoralis TaxID=2650924 RepID=A0A2W2BMB1_9HYPH|nr:sugar ABC transporter ATP-binding protein [Aestuariivirga litoralis]PZF77369.1 D-xylose ABC transporter ATP-binding protein [Aestuariivirga litoralis]